MRKLSAATAVALAGLSLGACGVLPAESAPETKPVVEAPAQPIDKQAGIDYWNERMSYLPGDNTATIVNAWKGDPPSNPADSRLAAADVCHMIYTGSSINEIYEHMPRVEHRIKLSQQMEDMGMIDMPWQKFFLVTIVHNACPELNEQAFEGFPR